jgi:hypothetical protein
MEQKILRRGQQPPKDQDYVLVVHRRSQSNRNVVVHDIAGSVQEGSSVRVITGPNAFGGSHGEAFATAQDLAAKHGVGVVYVRDDTGLD